MDLLLFQGQGIVYNPDDDVIGLALMFGFVKTSGASVCVANRIFETRLYSYFLTAPQVQRSVKEIRLDGRILIEAVC